MKIGLIFTAYNAADLLRESLTPWISARQMRLGGHQFKICAVSVPFEGFDEPRLDDTLGALERARSAGSIDNLILNDKPMKETEARTVALNWLVSSGCDAIWQWDADEITDHAEIQRVIRFIEARPLVTWFHGSLKNYVFDSETYLVEPFTPPRIHRVEAPGHSYHICGYWDDNNAMYAGNITRDIKRDIEFPSLTIPKSVAWTRHESWPSNARGKKKVEYQVKRWGASSFRWNEGLKQLEWNEAYFTQRGQSIPETAKD